MMQNIYVSQELDLSKISQYDYDLPIDSKGEIFGKLDARSWINRSGNSSMLCLFISTKENIKLKFYVFKNRKTHKYSPSSKDYLEVCCNDNLKMNDQIRIYYERSSKSDAIYIRQLDIIN